MHRGKGKRPTAPKGPPPGVTLFDPTKFQDKGQAAPASFAPPAGAPQYGQVGDQNSWGAQATQSSQGGGWDSWNWDANSWGSQTESATEPTPVLSGQASQQHPQHPNPQHQYQQPQQPPQQQEQNHHLGQQQQWEQQSQQQFEQNAWNQSNHQQGEAGSGAPPANQMMQGNEQQQQYDQWQQQQYWQGQGSNQGTEGYGQWGTGDGQWSQQHYGADQAVYGQQYGHSAGGDSQGQPGGEVGGVQQGYQGSYGQGFEHSMVEQPEGQQFPSSHEQAAVLESFSSESVSHQQGFPPAGSGNPPQGHASPMVNFFSPDSSGNQSDFLQQSGGSDFLQQSGGSDFLQQSGGSDFLQQSADSDFLGHSGNSESLDRSGATHSSNQSEKSESSPPRDLGASQSREQFGSLPEDRSQAARGAPSLAAPPIVASVPEEEEGAAANRGLTVGFAVPDMPESDESHLKVNMFRRTDSGISNASLSTLNYSVSSASLEDRDEKQAVEDLADQMDNVSLGDDQQPAQGSSSDLNHSAVEGQGLSTPGGGGVEEDLQSSNMGDWEFVQKTQSLASSSSQHSRASSLDQAVTSALVGPSVEGGPSSEEALHPSLQHPPHQGSPQPAPHPGSSAPPAASAPLGALAPPAPSPSVSSSMSSVQSGREGRTSGDGSQQTVAPPQAVSTSGAGSSGGEPVESKSEGGTVSISETTRALEEMTAGLSSLVQGEGNRAAGQERRSNEAAGPRPRPQDLGGRGCSGSGSNPLPDMFKKPGAPPKSAGARPAASSAPATREGPSPAASLASQKRQPGGHSSAFSKVPTSRTKHNMSPATTLWENPDIPAANILLAPAAAPMVPSLAPVGGSNASATSASSTARSPAPPSLVASAASIGSSNPAGVDSGTSILTESSMALPSQRPSSRGEGRSQARDGRRGRGYGDDSREDDNRSMNSLDELDAIPEPGDDPRDRRARDYYGYDPRYDKEGYDRRRYRDYYRERYGEDRYERPRSRHEDDRPASRGESERPQSRSEVDRDRRYRYDYDRQDPYYRDRYRGYGYDYYSRGDYYDRYYDQYYGRDSRYARGYQEEMRYRHANYQERYPQDYWGRQGPAEGYEQGSLYSGSRGNTPGPDDSRLGYEEPGSEHYHNASGYGYDAYGYDYYHHGDGYDYSGYQQEYTPGRMTPHKFNIPHVRACFGPGGQLVKAMPNRPADGQPAVVELHDVSAMLPDCPAREELSSFPGPLLRNDTHKNDVLLFCQKKARACAENIGMVDRESAELIWRLLELMIKQNGTMVGSDLAELLLSGHEPSYEEYEGSGGLRITTSMENLDTVGLDQTDAVPDYSAIAADRSQINAGRSRGEITGRFRHLLFYGRKKDALEWAMKNDLWGHALFLASKMDTRTHANVMTRFANNAMLMNDPLQSLYQLMSGRQPAAVTCICDEGWGDWRPHLAMMLSNNTQRTDLDRKCIASLGDTLASKGFLHASHFCYLMAQCKFGPYSKKTSKLVLIGANHYLPVMEFATNEAIQCTEVFEYAQSLGQVGYIIHHFQLYKFLYATRLAEYGFPQEALHYCEVVSQNVVNTPAFYSPAFVRMLYNLSSQLKMHDPQLLQGSQEEGEEPAWLTRLSQTLGALQDGSIQPASGQATPSLLPTATSSESGDITSASLENYNTQYQAYPQEGGYGQEGYGYTGEATYSQDAAYQQQQYGYQQQEGYAAPQTGMEGYSQPQATGEGQVGQMGQQAAAGMEGWDASQSAQVPPLQSYSGQQWEGNYEAVQGEGVQTQGGYPQPGGQRGSFASTASVAASVEEDGEDEDNVDEGGHGGSSFDYFGAATAHKIIAPPSRFRTNSTSSTGSHPQRQRTVSESSTSSISVANPKRDASHPHSPKKSQAPPPPGPEAQKNQKGGGWFGGLFSKFSKPKNEMKLPDDKDPSIVWDSAKKRWVNTDDNSEPSGPPPPPPRDADISGPPAGGMPPPSGAGNRYSLNKAGGPVNKYVDVMNPGKSNGTPAVPSNIFSVLPPSSSSAATPAAPAIFNPSGPGSSQVQLPSVVAEQPSAGGEAAEQQAGAPPAGPMLFNPAQFQQPAAPLQTAPGGGPKFGQRRKYPKQ